MIDQALINMRALKATSLVRKLKDAGIPSNAYTLYSEPKDETLTLRFEDCNWKVYYYERGIRSGIKEFEDRLSAEKYFWNEIISWFKYP